MLNIGQTRLVCFYVTAYLVEVEIETEVDLSLRLEWGWIDVEVEIRLTWNLVGIELSWGYVG